MSINISDISDEDAPKISFPCEDYAVKIIGLGENDFRETVLNIVERHAPGFDASKMTVNISRKGNYQSMTLYITATGPEQLSALNDDLRKSPLVKLVL